jgi:TP901 family phage tail tape measure protein
MASAVIGALRVNLGIDSAEFQNGLKQAQASLRNVGKSMQSAGRNISGYMSAPLAALGVLTLKTAGDFEAAMNRVGAASNASTAQLKTMKEMALDLGTDTSKSASEAANAMEMLAKNGVSVEDILGGAAVASVKLSEATGGDLSTAADVATNVMSQFKIEAKDLGRIVDGITGVTLQSQFGFEDYKDALAQAGGVAGALGVSIEEFNAAVAATSPVFNSGSDAGTSFKTFLTTLVPKSKQAAAAMRELGLDFFNADGSMKSMAAIAEELKTSLSGLSDEAKNEALHTIFGTDAMRTAIALADQGAAGIDKITAAVSRAGSAEEQAAARMKGFNGEMEKLAGALETLAIRVAESGLLQFFTEIVKGLAGLVEHMSTTNPELLKWGSAIAVVGAALGPVVIALGLMATAVAAIGAPILAVVAGITALTAAVVIFWPEIQKAAEYLKQLLDMFLELSGQALNAVIEKFKELGAAMIASLAEKGREIIAIFKELPGQLIQIGRDLIQGLMDGINERWEALKGTITSIPSYITDSFKSVWSVQSPSRVFHEIGGYLIQGLANGITGTQPMAVTAAQESAGAITSAYDGMDQIGSTLASSLGSAFSAIIDGSKKAKDVVKDLLKQLANLLMNQAFKQLFGGLGGGGGSDPWAGLRSVGGGGGGGFLSSIFSGLFGFAGGGSFKVGGAGGIDSQLVAFKASPNETVNVTRPDQERHGSAVEVRVGVSVDDDGKIRAYVTDMGAKAAQTGAAMAVRNVKSSMPSLIADAQTRQM